MRVAANNINSDTCSNIFGFSNRLSVFLTTGWNSISGSKSGVQGPEFFERVACVHSCRSNAVFILDLYQNHPQLWNWTLIIDPLKKLATVASLNFAANLSQWVLQQ